MNAGALAKSVPCGTRNLNLFLFGGLLVDDPALRRLQHKLIVRAKLPAARFHELEDLRARGAGECEKRAGKRYRDPTKMYHASLLSAVLPRDRAGR